MAGTAPRDPWDILRAEGFEATNGYRTDGDVERIRAQGYTPAPKGAHNRGDGVDLTHPRLSPSQQTARLNALAKQHGWKATILDEGHHRHLAIPGWGKAPGTPGTPNAGIPPLPPGFDLVQRGSLKATGQVHDGDTFKLTTGRNARLRGVDAFELDQRGRTTTGGVIPLGLEGRNYLTGQLGPQSIVNATGEATYGRPVVTVGPNDPAIGLLRNGLGLAAPEFLKGTPQFAPYMDAERQARFTRQGAHGNSFQTPAGFRSGNPDPWQKPEQAKYGEGGVAVFGDERTPFMGLRPEIEKGYLAIWNDPKSKPEDLIAFAKANGFEVSEEFTRKQYAQRFKGGDKPDSKITYGAPPRLLTNVGDGATGAAVRGFGDPINMLDELGGLANTLVPGARDFDGARENIWSSNRRFGDILWDNIDANRSILQYDDERHPIARIGGQLASGVVLPVGAGARTPLAIGRVGAAEGFLAGFGAGEGGPLDRLPNAAAGTVIGGAGGYALGRLGQEGVDLYRTLRNKPEAAGDALREASAEAMPILNDGAQNAGPTPAARSQAQGGVIKEPPIVAFRREAADIEAAAPPVPAGHARLWRGTRPDEGAAGLNYTTDLPGIALPFRKHYGGDLRYLDVPEADLPRYSMAGGAATDAEFHLPPELAARSAAMRVEDASPSLVGPELRTPDYINVNDLPPLPEGFTLEGPFGGARRMDERLPPEAMARMAEDVDPSGAIPRPSNQIGSYDEFQKANPGRFEELQAPNPLDELGVRRIPSSRDLFRNTKIRGPFDVTKQVRRWGGVQDQGGELAHSGITNASRKGLEFGGNEFTLGRLINNETDGPNRGMTLDELGERLYDEGWLNERPTTAEVVDILARENRGESLYHPESLNEVEAFRAAQEEADRIAKARDEGAPLVDERGDTINLDDLIANTPPTGAYEEMPRLTGRVGNLNLDRLEKPQDVGALVDQISKRVGGFSGAARGKVTHEETKALAAEIGLKPEDLLKRRQGQALNAEQLYAARSLVQRSRETVARLAKKAVGGSEEDLATFRKAWLRHVAIEEEIAGATAEAGRALSQFRMLANAQDAGANAVRAYLKGIGGRESIEEAAEALVDLMEDPAKANHFLREAVKPRWRDKFNELWVNSLLSGPRTHVVNFVGNAMTTLMSFPEAAMTAAIGKVTRSADRAYFGEIGARAAGMADSSIEALKRARKAFATGEDVDATSKIDAVHQKAIGGKVGEVIRIPTRALTASDAFWKGLLGGAELRQVAYRRAVREGSDKADVKSRYEALLRNPPDDLVREASEAARYYTFQKALGPAGRGVQQVSNNWVGGKIILPFVRTPINLLKFAGERSIFAVAMPEVRAALRAGGRQRDEALGRITLGSGLSTAAVMGAMEGKVTGGGPTDPRERQALLQSGWQPYSIRVGDKWVSYQRFDPLSTVFGVAADFAEVGQWATDEEADTVALNLVKSIAKNITNKTWLSGLSDAFDVLSDPQRYGDAYVRKQAASMAVPAILSQSAQALDPEMRETRTVLDAIKARVPVLSEGLPVRRNIWGDPVDRGDAIGPDLVSPFYSQSIKTDELSQEIARLRPPLTMPQRYLMIGGQRVDLTAQQYDELVQLTGKPAKVFMQDALRTPEWRRMNDSERRAYVKKAFKDLRAAGRAELKRRYPGLANATDDEEEASFTPAPAAPPLPPMPAPGNGLPPLPPGFSIQPRPTAPTVNRRGGMFSPAR